MDELTRRAGLRPGGRDAATRLRWRAGIAVGTVAALMLAGAVAVRTAGELPARDASILNAAGRQRMRSEGLVAGALMLARRAFASDHAQARERFEQRLTEWQAGHASLLALDGEAGFGSGFAHDALGPAHAELAPAHEEVAAAANALIAATARSQPDPAAVDAAVDALVRAEPSYLAVTDRLVAQVEAEVTRRAHRLASFHTWLMGATLVSLVLVGLIAFEPAARTLRRQLLDLRRLLFDADLGRSRAEAGERSARESEARFRALAENAHDVIIEIDASLRILYASPSHQVALGRSVESLLGKRALRIVHPDDAASAAAAARTLFERVGFAGLELRLRHADGTWRAFECSARPFETGAGELHAVVVARDITERRREEQARARLEEQVREMQRLESLAMLAGGVAHDFNNLLTAVLGNAQLAMAELPEHAVARQRLQRVVVAGRRAAELTTQLLTYSGRGSPHVRRVDLSKLVEEMADLLRVSVPEHVKLDCELAGDLPPVEGDPTQLRQLVMNLLLNGMQAIGSESGWVRLRTHRAQVDPAFRAAAQLGSALSEGTYVGLEVADSGPGLDADARGRIFDPFYTTRRDGRGLGLSVVLGILRTHRGAVRVVSERGRGTSFQVVLPPAVEEPAPTRVV